MWWLDADLFSFVLGEYVSCVLWSGLYHITGTDIVRALVFRFEAFGAYFVHSYYLCDSWLLIGSVSFINRFTSVRQCFPGSLVLLLKFAFLDLGCLAGYPMDREWKYDQLYTFNLISTSTRSLPSFSSSPSTSTNFYQRTNLIRGSSCVWVWIIVEITPIINVNAERSFLTAFTYPSSGFFPLWLLILPLPRTSPLCTVFLSPLSASLQTAVHVCLALFDLPALLVVWWWFPLNLRYLSPGVPVIVIISHIVLLISFFLFEITRSMAG